MCPFLIIGNPNSTRGWNFCSLFKPFSGPNRKYNLNCLIPILFQTVNYIYRVSQPSVYSCKVNYSDADRGYHRLYLYILMHLLCIAYYLGKKLIIIIERLSLEWQVSTFKLWIWWPFTVLI